MLLWKPICTYLRVQRDNLLCPCTIAMLLSAHYPANSPVGSYKGVPLANVTVCGLVVEQANRSVGMTFTLEDGTGMIECTLYIDDKQKGSGQQHMQDHMNKYVKVTTQQEQYSVTYAA